MKEEKQIEEMAKVIKSSLDGLGCGNFNFTGEEISTMFAKALHNADYRKQEWISVDERLPEDTQMCLAYATVYFVPDHVDDCDHCERIIVTKYYKEFGFMDWDVHYWMPLPEAPKMKGGAE